MVDDVLNDGSGYSAPQPLGSDVPEPGPVTGRGGFGASPSGTCSVHPGVSSTFTCVRCGDFGCEQCLETRYPAPLCTSCAARGVNAPAWERRRDLGWSRAFIDTTKEACFSPSKFFARQRNDGFMGGAGYGTIAYTLGQVALMLQFALLFVVSMSFAANAMPGQGQQGEALIGMSAIWMCIMVPTTLVTAPINALFGIVFSMIGAHLPLLAMSKNGDTFEETGSAVGYANAGHMLNLIPCFGMLIAPFYVIALEVIAIRETHQCGTGIALVAVLFWRLLIIGLIVLLYATLIVTMFNAAMSV